MNEANLITQTTERFYEKDRLVQMLTIAEQFVKANCFGKDVQNAQQAYVKIQAGAEMGMAPMESMNSLYIVNGHVTMWGSALTKRLRAFGWQIQFTDETAAGVTVTIKKDDETYSYSVTSAEMIKMTSRAYAFAPKEKMRWHGLSRLVRFNVPEVMGNIQYTQEEAEDFRPEIKTAVVIDPAKAEQDRMALIVQADALMKKKGKAEEQVVKFYKAESLSALIASDLKNVIAMLETIPDVQEQPKEDESVTEAPIQPELIDTPEKSKKKAISKEDAEKTAKAAEDTFNS